MLGALESPAPDPNDPATRTCTPPPGRDYTPFLKTDALKGARIGIPRAFFYDRITPPGPTRESTSAGGAATETGTPRPGANPRVPESPAARGGPLGTGGPFGGRGGGLN